MVAGLEGADEETVGEVLHEARLDEMTPEERAQKYVDDFKALAVELMRDRVRCTCAPGTVNSQQGHGMYCSALKVAGGES